MSPKHVDTEKKQKRSTLAHVLLFLMIAVVAAAGVALVKLYEQEAPELAVLNDAYRIGVSKEILISVKDDKSGIRGIEAYLTQGSQRSKVFAKTFSRLPKPPFGGPLQVDEAFTVNSRSLGLAEGKAELLVTVRDFSWRNGLQGNVETFKFPMIIDTRPPVIRVTAFPRYIKPGSAGVVVYQINEPVDKHGVQVNDEFHPGFRLEGKGDGVYGAIIGLPYDTELITTAQVSAADPTGNEGLGVFSMILRKEPPRNDRITISDGFLRAKIPEFSQRYPDLTGSQLDKYLHVNNQIREENYREIRRICNKSLPERLWDGGFIRMAGSSRRAAYADHRGYYYQGRKVDDQVHMGIDLASTRFAKVQAANRGMVVFADYLGIYGNTVIQDHGQGVFSLYSHLSQIHVQVYDMVDKGAVLGLTGTSGMAGGDHLHFGVLINGIFVNPVEWWDNNWIKINILSYL